MRINNQKTNKRKISSFILVGVFVLFLILSFFSINNVYAFNSGIITSDIDEYHVDISLISDLNQNNLILNNNVDFQNEFGENMSSNEIGNSGSFNSIIDMNKSTNIFDVNCTSKVPFEFQTSCLESLSSDLIFDESHYNRYAENNSNGDSLEKIDEISIHLNNIYSDNFYSIFRYPGFDSEGHFNDIDHINHDIILPISSLNLKGNSIEYFNNFIKKISNINFNSIDNDEDIPIIQYFQSNSYQTLTILFFIKIFIDYHNNGKNT